MERFLLYSNVFLRGHRISAKGTLLDFSNLVVPGKKLEHHIDGEFYEEFDGAVQIELLSKGRPQKRENMFFEVDSKTIFCQSPRNLRFEVILR